MADLEEQTVPLHFHDLGAADLDRAKDEAGNLCYCSDEIRELYRLGHDGLMCAPCGARMALNALGRLKALFARGN